MGELYEFRRHKRTQTIVLQWRRVAPGVAPFLLVLLVGLGFAVRPSGTSGSISRLGSDGTVGVSDGGFTLCGTRWDHCVIDGDTIRYGGVRIRVEDIDAPETHEPRCASELALGQRATRRLLELVNAGPFEIVYTGGRNHDRYGRELRRLERGGKSLGEMLVEEGLARRWDGARHPWCY
jgi:micrococcal nuclease